MRVKVRFQYNSETGEVETFLVEDVGGSRHGREHDAIHEAIAADVARVVEQHALIEEIHDGREPQQPQVTRRPDEETSGEQLESPLSE